MRGQRTSSTERKKTRTQTPTMSRTGQAMAKVAPNWAALCRAGLPRQSSGEDEATKAPACEQGDAGWAGSQPSQRCSGLRWLIR